MAYIGGLAQLCGKSLRLLFLSPLKRGRLLQRAVHQAMTAGVGALPIISLITFFVGVIIALQGAYELQRLGAMQLVASLVAISITRELGPLITAIVVIGRSGSAFAAEIGTMRVTEELDALETMALDPIAFLVAAEIPGHGRHDALPGHLVGSDGRPGRLRVRHGRRRFHLRQLSDCHARRAVDARYHQRHRQERWSSGW